MSKEIQRDEDMIVTALEAVNAALKVLEWTRAKLVDAQEENRKLKRIILELTEGCDGHS